MSNDYSEREGFLLRWSRRKRAEARSQSPVSEGLDHATPPSDADELVAEQAGRAESAAVAPQPNAEPDAEPSQTDAARRFDDFDFDALDYDSDYTQFMGSDVPDHVRNRALSKLWTSDPVLANVDGLNDYADDFTSKGVAVGAIATAYRVGKGFLTDAEAAEWDRLGHDHDSEDPDAAKPVAPGDPSAAGAAAASVAAPSMAHAALTNHPLPVTISAETPDQAEVRAMFDASNALSNSLYPAESNHPVTPAQIIARGGTVLVARTSDAAAVGCGAILCQPSGEAEIKRMWVDPDVRRGGVGRQVLTRLIDEAAARNIRVVRLETGTRQIEALALYRSFGFVECGPFGGYHEDPNSIFMELVLVDAAGTG